MRTPSILMLLATLGCGLSSQALPAEKEKAGSGTTPSGSIPPRAADGPAPSFRFEEPNAKSLGLWEGRTPVLVYNHGLITHGDGTDAPAHSCYVHPLYGLDGEVLTDDFPKDHLYHRGLYWAWPHITIDGRDYSLWDLRGIRPQFLRWLTRETSDSMAVLGVESAWIVEEEQAVMRERIQLRVHRATALGRAIDLEAVWTPIDRPIALRGAADKGYGGLTLRFAAPPEVMLTLPEGRAREDTVMTRHPWTDFSGRFPGAPARSGAAIFVHPRHPDFPLQWVNRHYGMVAAGWPGTTPKVLAAGESVTCRYRIWIHRGTPDAAELQRVYQNFQQTVP